MSKTRLGRVTGAIDVPRGPDVKHRVRVPQAWFDEGAEVEIELPRNLTCAACDGGGCDRCERAGAISLRGRKEPSELVRVTLPRRKEAQHETTASGRALVVRIPERGGISEEDLPRGLLLLQLTPADAPDSGVERVARAVTPRPPAPPAEVPAAPPGSRLVLWVAVVVVLWVLFLVWLRLTGRG